MGFATLRILALAKLAVVAVFFASFLPASASFAEASASNDAIHCNGINLVEKLRDEDPEKLSQIRAEAEKIKYGKNIFWKLNKPGNPPSWLLGTMHMTDPQATKLSPEAELALQISQTVLIESTETMNPKAAVAALGKLRHLTFLGGKAGLKTMLTPTLMQELESRLTSRGIPLQVANQLRPWVIATMIAVPACELAAKKSGAKILDHRIAQHALDNGKQLHGLETTEEQFSAIAGLPQKYHLANLQETLTKDTSHVEDMIATMKALYREEDIGLILPLMKALTPETLTGEGAADFQKAMITERNKTMANRADEFLEKGNAFIAVGALHLPGKLGLVQLLQDRGYTVTAVASGG